MDFYPENRNVEIKVPYRDDAGAAIVPSDVVVAVYDGEGRLLISGPVAFDPNGVEAVVTISASTNALAGDELREVRRVEVRVVHPEGSIFKSFVYGIEAGQSLQIMKNSFMTYDMALLMAQSHVNLEGFMAETEPRQKAALMEAYRRICSLSVYYTVRSEVACREFTHRLNISSWPEVTEDVFQTQFPSHFKRALRNAQLVEADELLQGNVVARKHAQGIAAETIGESSVTFREGFASTVSNSLGASARAVLNAYLDRTIKIGRV